MHTFKGIRNETVYDLDNNEAYLTKMNEIKMKSFYGKHPMKYTGDLQPDAPCGQKGVFAKLKDTHFRNTQDGWATNTAGSRGGHQRTRSVNVDRYNEIKGQNNKLQSKLNELQERLNSRGDARSQRSDKIFS